MSYLSDPVNDVAPESIEPANFQYWAENVFVLESVEPAPRLNVSMFPIPPEEEFFDALITEAADREYFPGLREKKQSAASSSTETPQDGESPFETEEESETKADQFLGTITEEMRAKMVKIARMSHALLTILLSPPNKCLEFFTKSTQNRVLLHRNELIVALRGSLVQFINEWEHDEITSGEPEDKERTRKNKKGKLTKRMKMEDAKTFDATLNQLFPSWELKTTNLVPIILMRQNSILHLSCVAYQSWIKMKMEEDNIEDTVKRSLTEIQTNFQIILRWLANPAAVHAGSINTKCFFHSPLEVSLDQDGIGAFVKALVNPNMKYFFWRRSWFDSTHSLGDALPRLDFGELCLNKQAIRDDWPKCFRHIAQNKWGLSKETDHAFRAYFDLSRSNRSNSGKKERERHGQNAFRLHFIDWLSKNGTEGLLSPKPEQDEGPGEAVVQTVDQSVLAHLIDGPEDVEERRLANLNDGPRLKLFLESGLKTIDGICDEIDEIFEARDVPAVHRHGIKEKLKSCLGQYVTPEM